MLRRLPAAAAVAGLLASTAIMTPTAVAAPLNAAGSVAPSSHQPSSKHVTVSVDYRGRVHMPSRLRSGRHTFSITSKSEAMVQLAHPARGYTAAEFVRDYNAPGFAPNERRFTRLGRLAGGALTGPRGTASFTTTLYPGTYFVYNDDFDLTVSKLHVITVTGPVPASKFPRVTGTIKIGDSGFTAPAKIRRSGEALIRNSGRANHQMMLIQLPDGMSIGDLREMLAEMGSQGRAVRTSGLRSALKAAGHEEDEDFEPMALDFAGKIGPDTSFVWKYSLPAGNYAMLDFAMDGDGMPGFFTGHRLRGIRLV